MRLILFFVLAAVTLVPVVSQPKIALPNEGLEIVQRFGGTAKMVVSEELESKEPPPLLITDQAGFERFTSLLPQNDVTRES